MTTHLVMQNRIAMATTASLVQTRKKQKRDDLHKKTKKKKTLATTNIPPDEQSRLPVAVCASWNFFSAVVVSGIRSGVGAPLPAARSLCSVVLMRGREFPHAPPPVREPGWQWCKACLRAGSIPAASRPHTTERTTLDYTLHLYSSSAQVLLRGASWNKKRSQTASSFFFFFFLSDIFLNESGCVVSLPPNKNS